jgi:light-regulated signal transduction histidine kinase (bacteriophytochrome)
MEIEIYQRAQSIKETNNTLEKLTEDLKEANKKLQGSNEQLKEFAYVASHDLQEPLRMISHFLQLLEKRYQDKLDKDAKEFIFYAVDGAERMKQLINDLLTYSRIESQGRPLQEIDMQEPLNWALSNLQRAIEAKEAKIFVQPLPHIKGDSTQMGMLWQNLIENALRYHQPQRPLKIHIGFVREENTLKFLIKDNGIGIDPQFHQRIFKIFQRLHSQEEYEGTGVGLAVCKKIVDRHGGRMWVESELDQGSTFYFTVPNFSSEAKQC